MCSLIPGAKCSTRAKDWALCLTFLDSLTGEARLPEETGPQGIREEDRSPGLGVLGQFSFPQFKKEGPHTSHSESSPFWKWPGVLHRSGKGTMAVPPRIPSAYRPSPQTGTSEISWPN